MKLTSILLLVAILHVSAAGYSQRITLHFRHQSLEKIFDEITRQTGYGFFYQDNIVVTGEKVSVFIEGADIAETMQKCLAGKRLQFSIVDRTIIVYYPKSPPAIQPNVQEPPSRLITGVVVSSINTAPLAGASVKLKGTTHGTTTDAQGKFSLSVPDSGGILVISYVGYHSREIQVDKDTKLLTISLLPEDTRAPDVIVVGYGTQLKAEVTGSVGSLKGTELSSASNTNAAQALQGRIAGVFVQNTSGVPFGDVVIRIRGANSLTYGNDPLIVIDGVQGANIGNLNPTEVESIEVLKDAAALSIYGSRGANGVILVTTRNGKSPTPKIAYDDFFSSDQVRRKLPVLNATDYASLVNEAQNDYSLPSLFSPTQLSTLGNGTNWQDAIFRTGVTQNHNLSIGGSKEGISYFLGGGLVDRTGIILNSTYKQYTLRSNLKVQASPRLTIALTGFVSYDRAHSGDYSDAITSALEWSPTKTIYDSTGGYTQPGGGVGPVASYNPVGLAKEIVQDNFNTALTISPSIDYKLTSDLHLNSQLAYRLNNTFSGYFNNQVVNDGPPANVYGTTTMGRDAALQNTNMVTFEKKWGEQTMKLTGVYEISQEEYRFTTASANGIPVGLGYNGLAFGTTILTPSNGVTNTAGQSFMGRLNYSYNGRYMITVSDRYDGASQLAPGHKFENFGAVSGGWNIMNESFMEGFRSAMPVLKIRGSYGSVGNSAVPAYSSEQLFSAGVDANGNPIITLKQLANPNLKWERTTETNLGLDSRLLHGRLDLSADYYYKKTTDLLMWQNVPAALGVTAVLTNVGSVSNKGIDLMIGGTPVTTRSFKWQSTFTLNYNRNKILALDGISDTIYYSSAADYPGVVGSFVQMVGQPMGTFLGFKFAGVWKQSEATTAALYGSKPGDAKYVDINHDGKIDRNDITIIGNAQPKFNLGWTNTFTYRQFDLNIFWQGVSGNKIYNENRIRREAYTTDAFPTSPVIADHWTATHDNTNVPAFTGFEYLNESRWVENGSYLRLKNISLGYQLPKAALARSKCISSARVYIGATNLLTITSYTGFDPEASIGVDATAAGVDRSIYPSQKSITAGLNIVF
jgi:TonB-linked SusC/RagA family outer membrane protein